MGRDAAQRGGARPGPTVDRHGKLARAARTQAPRPRHYPPRTDPSGPSPAAARHLAAFPTATGYVFRGPRGGRIADSTYLPYFQKARAAAFTPVEAASPLAETPYALRHAAVSTWLNSGVDPAQVAAWAGHSVAVLMRIYVKCISGHDAEAKRRILEATKLRTVRSEGLGKGT